MTNDINDQLIEACIHGKLAEVNRLIKDGANPNTARVDNATALHVATYYGYTEVAKVLLAAGANPNAADNDGWTALMHAAIIGYTEVTKVLLDNGANPNAADNDGKTALMLAAAEGHEEFAKMLLSVAANPNATDNDGKTALDIAKNHRRSEIIRILWAEEANSGSRQQYEEKRKSAENTAAKNEKNAEILFRHAMQKVHPDRAPEHLQGMCQKLTAELNAARKVRDYRKIREIAESVGVSISDEK